MPEESRPGETRKENGVRTFFFLLLPFRIAKDKVILQTTQKLLVIRRLCTMDYVFSILQNSYVEMLTLHVMAFGGDTF
jgi:hypothetical protein